MVLEIGLAAHEKHNWAVEANCLLAVGQLGGSLADMYSVVVGLPVAAQVSVDIAEREVRLPAGEVADMKVLVRWVDVMSGGPKPLTLEVEDDGLQGQENE